MNKSIKEEAARVIREEAEALDLLARNIPADFERAVDIIYESKGRIVVSGIGKSGLIGRKVAATLSSTGQPAFFMHPSEAHHGDLGMIGIDDILFLISNSGESVELFPVIDFAKRRGNKIISISKNEKSTLARESDVALCLPDFREACPIGIAPTVSSTMTLALGDAIAIVLLRKRGFTMEQFKALHPGGSIGRKLLFIRDIMRKKMPLLRIDDGMQRAIIVISECGVGCAGIIGEDGGLLGIITDGDLRRHMAANLLTKSIKEVMTTKPIMITEDILCSEALRIMEDKKINNLFVVGNHDDKIPVGVIHLHDIVSKKIV
ncbi:MAG: KpsF/GutQ family sugar-phosphate isomerase [Holosporales bacterium]|jgi:arabinose-5-phosphate isomerase|nr:KpsF/GutQ family sugar-phosphate isomerase [Holosporales bacterium]